jgi:hypothetical protein
VRAALFLRASLVSSSYRCTLIFASRLANDPLLYLLPDPLQGKFGQDRTERGAHPLPALRDDVRGAAWFGRARRRARPGPRGVRSVGGAAARRAATTSGACAVAASTGAAAPPPAAAAARAAATATPGAAAGAGERELAGLRGGSTGAAPLARPRWRGAGVRLPGPLRGATLTRERPLRSCAEGAQRRPVRDGLGRFASGVRAGPVRAADRAGGGARSIHLLLLARRSVRPTAGSTAARPRPARSRSSL